MESPVISSSNLPPMEKQFSESIPPNLKLFTLVSATGLGVFMGSLDGSVVNVSIYNMQQFFGVTVSEIQWVILIYLLVIASFTTIAGKLGDRFSNKIVFQYGMIIFTLGSFLCSISPSLEILIIARIIQALGSTGVTANGIAIVTRFTTPKNRGKAIGWNSIFVASALTTGPILGGILTYFFGWPSIFLINVPIGIFGLFWVQKAIPPTPPRDVGKKIDYLGALLFGGFMFLEIGGVSIIDFTNLDLTFIGILAVITGFILFFLFFFQSKKKDDPIIDIKLFYNKTFVIGILTAVFAFTLMNMITFQLPLLAQNIYRYNEYEAGIILLGIPLAMALVGPIAGRLSDKYDPKYLTTFACIGLTLVMTAFTLTTSLNFIWYLTIPISFLLGFMMAMFTSPNGNSVMSSVPKNRLGVAGGFIGVARTFGFSLGVAFSTMIINIFQPIYISQFGGGIASGIYYIQAYQTMLVFGVIIAFIAIFTTYQRPLISRTT